MGEVPTFDTVRNTWLIAADAGQQEACGSCGGGTNVYRNSMIIVYLLSFFYIG